MQLPASGQSPHPATGPLPYHGPPPNVMVSASMHHGIMPPPPHMMHPDAHPGLQFACEKRKASVEFKQAWSWED
uniref:Uncharacterized protein n=1 Tax=Plectus sambesii TaxID=2011161 RepID=A0A914X2C8_9BILA